MSCEMSTSCVRWGAQVMRAVALDTFADSTWAVLAGSDSTGRWLCWHASAMLP